MVINKVYFPVMLPVGVIGNILSFLVSFIFAMIQNVSDIAEESFRCH